MNQSKFRIRGLRKHPECVQKFGSVQGALGHEREKCRWPELSRKNSLQIIYFFVFAVQVNQSHRLDYFKALKITKRWSPICTLRCSNFGNSYADRWFP